MKRLQRLGLLLGPLMVAFLLANMIAGISPVEAARKTVSKASAVCPTDASAITSMSVKITRAGNVLNRSNLATVLPGDIVKVTFDLNDACTNYRVSLVSYKAPDATNNLDTLSQRVISSSQSLTFGAAGGSLQVTVPTCYNATIFAVGAVIGTMSPTNVYGARQKDTVNSGSSACAGIGAPTPTYFSSNPTCSTLGSIYGESWAEYKIDGAPTNGTRTLASGGYSVTVSSFNGSNTFSWSSAGTALKGVFVKASTGGNLYRYGSGSFGASNLKSVAKPDGTMYGISHVLFCFAPIPTTAVCPTNKSAVTAYRFEIWRGTVKTNATDLNNVQQGDLIKAFFDLAPGCTDIRVSFAGYEARENYYNIDTVSQQIYKVYQGFPGDTGLYSATQPATERMVQTVAPPCNFQVDFVFGPIKENLTPTNLYGDLKFAWKNGGTTMCQRYITPTATNTANATQTQNANNTATASANLTATAVVKTATASANQTATSAAATAVVKTATASANQTATSAAATQTATAAAPAQTASAVAASQTASAVAATITAAPGVTQTAIANQTASAVAATQTSVAVVTETASAVAPTETYVAAVTQTANAVAETQTAIAAVTETASAEAPTETFVAAMTETAGAYETETVEAAWTATPVATATPQVGQLQIHKVDQDGLLLYGACFEVYGESFAGDVCDDDQGVDSNGVSGEIWLDGLLEGTYTVQETSAPSGYVGDFTLYQVFVPAGSFGEKTIVNTVDETPTGTIISIWKLNCESMPGSVNAMEVANGNLPDGCVLSPSGVTFTIEQLTAGGAVVETVILSTTNGLVESFTVGTTVSDLRVTEHAGTNPFWMAAFVPAVFTEVQCACGHTDLVVVNLPDPANPTPMPTATPEEPTATPEP